MNSAFTWTVIGSIAGILAVATAVIFGILQARQGKKGSSRSGSQVGQDINAGRDAYTAGGDQYIVKNPHSAGN